MASFKREPTVLFVPFFVICDSQDQKTRILFKAFKCENVFIVFVVIIVVAEQFLWANLMLCLVEPKEIRYY